MTSWRIGLALATALFLFGGDWAVWAQPPAGRAPAAGAPAPGRVRKLAPGVLEKIDPGRKEEETSSRHDVVELLAVDQNFGFAKDVPFRHEVWYLDFQFKWPRLIWVDVPQPSGQMRRQLVWYMVYSVTNPGKVMVPVDDKPIQYPTKDPKTVWEVKLQDKPVKFIPKFQLEARRRVDGSDQDPRVFPDQLIPVALGPIQMREDPNRRLLNAVEICGDINPGETRWGVVTWTDLDPKMVRFSIYVQGLTNAYKWKDPPGNEGGYSKPGTDGVRKGVKLVRKTLKLNFWRPGDEFFEHEGEVYFGVPKELAPDAVDYEWVYLP